MTKMQIDYSTLNPVEINKLQTYQDYLTEHKLGAIGSRRYVSRHMGSACFMDAPGYPSYFIRSCTLGSGNDVPDKEPQQVLDYRGEYYVMPDFWQNANNWEAYKANQEAFYAAIYAPLPEDHPRVQAWIRVVYSYFRNCYLDLNLPEDTRWNAGKYTIRSIKLDELRLISDNLNRPDLWNLWLKDVTDRCVAYHYVRRYYPNHEFRIDLFNNPRGYGIGEGIGTWWERYAEKPTPDTCPGQDDRKHPVYGKTVCQLCGWDDEDWSKINQA